MYVVTLMKLGEIACTNIISAIVPYILDSENNCGRNVFVQKLTYYAFNCSNSTLAKTNAANPLRSFRSVDTPT